MVPPRWSWLAVAWVVGATGVARAQPEPEPADPPPPERPDRPGPRYPVTIDSDPAGATIYLDDVAYGEVGATPWKGRLAAGSYQLILELDGYRRVDATIEVRRKRRRRRRQIFDHVLQRIPTGWASVAAPDDSPALGVDIAVDGEPSGVVPATLELEVGPHQIQVRLPDDRMFEEWIEVVEGQTVDVEIAIAPPPVIAEPPPPPPVVVKPPVVAPPRATVSAGFALGGRVFDAESQAVTGLRPYDASFVPMVRVRGEVYPLVGVTGPVAAGVGLAAGYARAFALSSSTEEGDEIDTSWSHVDVSVRYRWTRGGTSAPIIGAAIGYGRLSYRFSDAGAIADEIPDSTYDYLSFGGDLRVRQRRFALFGGFAYRAVLDTGPFTDRFAAASAYGLAVTAGAAVFLPWALELDLAADYERFSHRLTAETGGVTVGATDQLFEFSADLGYRF